MSSGDNFDITHARQTYRAIRLGRMPELPAYATCVAVACRVGRAISAHAAEMPWSTAIQLSSAQAIRTANPNTALDLPPPHEQSPLLPRKYPQSESDRFLIAALKAFRFAADSTHIIDIERHAGMGRAYLDRAHRAAALSDTHPKGGTVND